MIDILALGNDSWRKELQDIAQSAGLTPREEEPPKQEVKRTSQYSAETGRLIPPPSKGYSRRSSRAKTQEQFISSLRSQRGDPLEQGQVEDTVSNQAKLTTYALFIN